MGVTNDDEIPVKELESSIPPTLKDKFEPSYDHIIPDMTVPDKDHSIPEHISDPSEIEYVHQPTIIAVDKNGVFIGKYVRTDIPPDTFPVTVDTDSAFRIWNFEKQEWGENNPPPPTSVSKKKFFIVLKDNGFMSQAEILAFYGRGEFPTVIKESFDFMIPAERENEEIELMTESEIQRNSLLVECLGKSKKLSSTQLDQLFMKCLSK
jgi:hypothetical protein